MSRSGSAHPTGVEGTWAVVLAGGHGARFGGEVPKQFRDLGGEPVLLHSLRALLGLAEVAGAVVPTAAEEIRRVEEEVLPRLELRKPVRVVPGGETRADSVRHGLDAVPASAEWVLVHDGARPNPGRRLLERLMAARREARAVVPALPVTDTLKRVDGEGRVVETVDRGPLVRVQTPQLFALDLLQRAHAAGGDVPATDDAFLVERLGEEVRVVEGDPGNIKLTRPEDLAVLEVWMGEGGGA